MELAWLTVSTDWKECLRRASISEPEKAFQVFVELARSRADFVRTGALDLAIRRYVKQHGVPASIPVVKMALLGSSTLSHLHAGIRLGALRRGVFVQLHEGDYGMYQQEILEPDSSLHSFRPDVVCLALDAHHLAGGNGSSAEAALDRMRLLWSTLKQQLKCAVIQQAVLPVFWPVMGNQEHRSSDSPATIVQAINSDLRREAVKAGVYLLTVDTWAATDGVSHWHDPALWFRSKQEIHPRASVMYGDQLGRLLAALRGVSAKCLVLDLDNTLWGGVIGDDGLDGIILGQGTTVGEAHVALQRYSFQLSQRGVILAVCSKNDEANALAPFEHHADMILRRNDIACFVANWQDKATNLRYIAHTLNIGLDALVFVDDNPAERALIRRELPMVQVPELPEDPAGFANLLASAGFFETVEVTEEDRLRAISYKANTTRERLRRSSTDMNGYLHGLQMELAWQPFTEISRQRIVQLSNKTNQFNLTTCRYSDNDIQERMQGPDYLTLQFRLSDIYGDNGLIGLIIGRREAAGVLDIETWLMSCRVLGRRVEEASLSVLAWEAARMGCHTLVGTYKPTSKNALVQRHYANLGFSFLEERHDGITRWQLPLEGYDPPSVPINILEGGLCKTQKSMAA